MNHAIDKVSTTDHSLYVHIPAWRKLTFGLMDTANNFSWSLVSSYLTIFYTDVFLIPTATVSILFIAARLWDAINDPAVGMLADRTHSKWGRFRPWIMFACIPLVMMTVITFTAHPSWPEWAKTVYVFVTYGILVLVYTCVNIPYSAMTSAITQDPRERGSLASVRLTCAVAGGLIVSQIIARLYPWLSEKTDPAKGYQLSALILGCCAIALYFLGVFTHKEVVAPSELQKKNRMPFRKMLKAALKDRACIIAILAHFAYGVGSYGRSTTYMYYFTYVLDDAVLMGTWIFFMNIPMVFGTFSAQFVANKLRSKGKVMVVAGVGAGLILLLEWLLVPSLGFAFLCITSIPLGFLTGWFASMAYAVIPDLTEVGQLESGLRLDGFYSSFTSFLNKIGIAVGTSGVVAVIGILGYTPNIVQNASVLSALSIFMYVLPGIVFLSVGLMFLGYKLDYDAFENVLAKVQAKTKKEEIDL